MSKCSLINCCARELRPREFCITIRSWLPTSENFLICVEIFLDIEATGKRFVFLDEITTVPRWEYAIKHIVDTGLGEDVLFVLTGSSSADLRRGGERLPGRRRMVQPDRVLLPLSFRQYCTLRG